MTAHAKVSSLVEIKAGHSDLPLLVAIECRQQAECLKNCKYVGQEAGLCQICQICFNRRTYWEKIIKKTFILTLY